MDIRKLICVAGCTLLAACAASRVSYSYSMLDFNAKPSNAPLRVAVQDHRPYVISGEKADTFVGLMRDGVGIPHDAKTASGKAFADDVASSIKVALDMRGAQVSTLVIPPALTENEAIAAVKDSARKTIFLRINNWKSDTYAVTAVAYDIDALVVDRDGKVLARKKTVDGQRTDVAIFATGANARTGIASSFRFAMEDLFKSQEIAAHI